MAFLLTFHTPIPLNQSIRDALYVPLVLLGRAVGGVGGIFAAATVANLLTDALAWIWIRRQENQQAGIPHSTRITVESSPAVSRSS